MSLSMTCGRYGRVKAPDTEDASLSSTEVTGASMIWISAKSQRLHSDPCVNDPPYILTISTLPRLYIKCSSMSSLALSSSVTVRGCTVRRAYEPGPLRFDKDPGLMTRTLSTTCLMLGSQFANRQEERMPYLCKHRQSTRSDQDVGLHIQPFSKLQITRIKHRTDR